MQSDTAELIPPPGVHVRVLDNLLHLTMIISTADAAKLIGPDGNEYLERYFAEFRKAVKARFISEDDPLTGIMGFKVDPPSTYHTPPNGHVPYHLTDADDYLRRMVIAGKCVATTTYAYAESAIDNSDPEEKWLATSTPVE